MFLLHSHIHVHAGYIHIYAGYILTQWIRTQWITDARRISLTIFTSHFIARVRKGCSRFACEMELEIEHNWNIFDPKLMAVTLCLSFFSICSTRGPEATLLGDGFLYGILSASSPDLNSSGPKSPFGMMWLSLSHLVCNSVRSSTQLPGTPT